MNKVKSIFNWFKARTQISFCLHKNFKWIRSQDESMPIFDNEDKQLKFFYQVCCDCKVIFNEFSISKKEYRQAKELFPDNKLFKEGVAISASVNDTTPLELQDLVKRAKIYHNLVGAAEEKAAQKVGAKPFLPFRAFPRARAAGKTTAAQQWSGAHASMIESDVVSAIETALDSNCSGVASSGVKGIADDIFTADDAVSLPNCSGVAEERK